MSDPTEVAYTGFDLASLDAVTPSEKGSNMIIYKPGTRDPVVNESGQPIYVTLRGRLSQSATNADRTIQISRLDRQKKQIILDTDAILAAAEQESIALLTACTAGWNFDFLDGNPFPFSVENARKMWSDPRFKRIREEAIQYINNDSVFLGV